MTIAAYPVGVKTLVSGKSLAGSYTSDPVAKECFIGMYIEATVAAGTAPTGAFKLQSSASGVNWVDVTSSSQSITDNATVSWNVVGAYYNFWRVVYTRTSGTGTLAILYNMQ